MGQPTNQSALILADESVIDRFVCGGVLRLPSDKIDDAVASLAETKISIGVDAEAEIHCRILFQADARSRSQFKALAPDRCIELVTACVDAMNAIGGTWFGCWVDRDSYPTELQLVEGVKFRVEAKHLAGIVVQGALQCVKHHVGADYRLAFDPDPTKIDWGLAARLQATHFARTHPQAITLPGAQKSLLEMADIAAYTIIQSLAADLAPNNRKAQNFPAILKRMQMRTSHLTYSPWLSPHVTRI